MKKGNWKGKKRASRKKTVKNVAKVKAVVTGKEILEEKGRED